MRKVMLAVLLTVITGGAAQVQARPALEPQGEIVRFASFNASLNRGATG